MPDNFTNADEKPAKDFERSDAQSPSASAVEGFHAELLKDRDSALSNTLSRQGRDSSNAGGDTARAPQEGTVAGGIATRLTDALRAEQPGGSRLPEHTGDKAQNKSGGSVSDLIANAIKNADTANLSESERNNLGKKIGQAMDKVPVAEKSENFNKVKDILSKPDGAQVLKTGDIMVREDGKETLYTPAGDKVTVNPDGSYAVKGDVKSVNTNKNGETTISFADGSRVSLDKEGLLGVERGNQAVSFPRLNFHINDPWHQVKPLSGEQKSTGRSDLPSPAPFPPVDIHGPLIPKPNPGGTDTQQQKPVGGAPRPIELPEIKRPEPASPVDANRPRPEPPVPPVPVKSSHMEKAPPKDQQLDQQRYRIIID